MKRRPANPLLSRDVRAITFVVSVILASVIGILLWLGFSLADLARQ